MRRIGLFTIAASLLATPISAQTVVVGVGGELSAFPGDSFIVPVFADLRNAGGEALGSYTLQVTWDDTELSLLRVTGGDFGSHFASGQGPGTMLVTAAQVAGANGVVQLFGLMMRYIGSGSSAISLQVTELSAAGTLTDLLGTATVTVVGGNFCPAVGRWGDVDGSNRVDSRDALIILSDRVALPIDPSFDLTMGDTDGDGVVNTRDALIILSHTVGLPIDGQRVMFPVPGTCGTGDTPSFVATPSSAELVVDQTVRLTGALEASDGTLLLGPIANVSVADPAIVDVDARGLVTARAVGTTSVHGSVAPGVNVVVPITVIDRRMHWYVDAQQAAQAPVQLGTQQYPVASPERIFPFVTEGDTIHILPGVHDYDADLQDNMIDSEIRAGVVVLGDTLPDGTRPVLRGQFGFGEAPVMDEERSPSSLYYETAAFDWRGGVRGELRNLIIENFDYGVYGDGIQNLELHNVEIRGVGDALYLHEIDSVLIRFSQFFSSFGFNNAVYISDEARLLRVLDSEFNGWGDAIDGYNIDFVDIQRNQFNDNNDNPIDLDTGGGLTRAFDMVLSFNTFSNNDGPAVEAHGIRTLFMDHNVMEHNGGNHDQIDIQGLFPTHIGSKVVMKGDTVRFAGPNREWLEIDDLDSLFIDSLYLEMSAAPVSEQSDIDINYVEVTDSKFLNLSGQGLDVRARKLRVDNSEFTGCPTCVLAANAILVDAHNDSGPTIEVTNSTFTNLGSAVDVTLSNKAAGPSILTNNTVDQVSIGFRVYGNGTTIADNIITNVDGGGFGIESLQDFSGRVQNTGMIERNQVSCVPLSVGQGILANQSPAIIADNTVTGCRVGIFGANASLPEFFIWEVLRNTIVSDASGVARGIQADGRLLTKIVSNDVSQGSVGIDLNLGIDTATAVIDSNVVTGTTTAALQISSGTVVTGRKNNFHTNAGDGIINFLGTGPMSFTLGRFVGNANFAVNDQNGTVFDVTQNWWGDPGGPGVGSADVVSSAIPANLDTSSPLGTDPEGVTVPAVIRMGTAAPPDATATRSNRHRRR